MIRIVTAALVLLMLVGAALAFEPGLGNRFGKLGASSKTAPASPQPTGKILMVDGVSHILQVDGVSKICRAGGC